MSANPITIRTLGPEDAFVLDRVRPGVFDGPLDPSRAWAFLATRVNVMVVALDRGEVVGFVSGTTMLRPDRPTAFRVDRIGVHADCRRQGVGRALLARLRDEARERGCESLWLAVGEDEAAAQALCRAAGGQAGGGVTVFVWELD